MAAKPRFISWCCQFLVQRSVSNVLICVRCACQLPRDVLFFVERFSSLHLEVGRQALHPTCPAASSATVASTSEGEGLHADRLPHSVCEYIFDVSVFFGGRGTALNPSSSHCGWVLRRRRDRPFSSQHGYVLCLPGFRR